MRRPSYGMRAPWSSRRGSSGHRERGFGTLEYERPFLDEIPDAFELVERAGVTGSRTTRSALTRRSPGTGRWTSTSAMPTPPFLTLIEKKSCQLLDAGQAHPPTQNPTTDDLKWASPTCYEACPPTEHEAHLRWTVSRLTTRRCPPANRNVVDGLFPGFHSLKLQA